MTLRTTYLDHKRSMIIRIIMVVKKIIKKD